MKEYIEKSVVERMLWAVIMSKDERTIEEMLEDASAVQAIPISKGATNGDVLETVFDIVEKEELLECVGVRFADKRTGNAFKKSWYNAPYNKEVEE